MQGEAVEATEGRSSQGDSVHPISRSRQQPVRPLREAACFLAKYVGGDHSFFFFPLAMASLLWNVLFLRFHQKRLARTRAKHFCVF
jgi:hypothetical protein